MLLHDRCTKKRTTSCFCCWQSASLPKPYNSNIVGVPLPGAPPKSVQTSRNKWREHTTRTNLLVRQYKQWEPGRRLPFSAVVFSRPLSLSLSLSESSHKSLLNSSGSIFRRCFCSFDKRWSTVWHMHKTPECARAKTQEARHQDNRQDKQFDIVWKRSNRNKINHGHPRGRQPLELETEYAPQLTARTPVTSRRLMNKMNEQHWLVANRTWERTHHSSLDTYKQTINKNRIQLHSRWRTWQIEVSICYENAGRFYVRLPYSNRCFSLCWEMWAQNKQRRTYLRAAGGEAWTKNLVMEATHSDWAFHQRWKSEMSMFKIIAL